MGWLDDFVSDPLGTIGDTISDVGDFAYNTQKNVIGAARGAVDSTLSNVDDLVKATGENIWDNAVEYPFRTVGNIASNPLDINSYSDSAADWYNANDDYSNEVFGTGGWKKAGLNFITSGNPMYGGGDVLYQGNAVLNNEGYGNGLISGPKTLMGMYNLGSNIGKAFSSPNAPYNAAATNTVNANMEPQIQDFSYDPSYDTSAYGQDSLLNYGGTAGSYSPLLGTSTSNPSYDFGSLSGAFNALKDYSQTPTGKLASTAMGVVSPEAGLVGAGVQGLGSGDWNPFVKGLAQMYLTNRAKSNADAYLNSLRDRIGSIDKQYSLEGDIAKGLEQRLARRDAATGRRSQYGARQTELAAQLAQLRAQQEAPILSALGSASSLSAQNAKTTAENQRVQSLMALWDQYNKPQFSGPPSTVAGGSGLNLGKLDLSNIWK